MQAADAAADSQNRPGITFCVEGNISAGKSTFLNYITQDNEELQQELGVSIRLHQMKQLLFVFNPCCFFDPCAAISIEERSPLATVVRPHRYCTRCSELGRSAGHMLL